MEPLAIASNHLLTLQPELPIPRLFPIPHQLVLRPRGLRLTRHCVDPLDVRIKRRAFTQHIAARVLRHAPFVLLYLRSYRAVALHRCLALSQAHAIGQVRVGLHPDSGGA